MEGWPWVLLGMVVVVTADVTHMTDSRCDPLIDGWGYLKNLDFGEAGPVVISNAHVKHPPEPFTVQHAPFIQDSRLAFSNGLLAWVDGRLENASHTTVWVGEMVGYKPLYFPRDAFRSFIVPNARETFFSWRTVEEWKAYQTLGTVEHTFEISFLTQYARQVVTDGDNVAWVDGPSPEGPWDIILYSRGADSGRWVRTLLPHQEECPSSSGAPVPSRVTPGFCGGKLVFTEVLGSYSRVVSYDVVAGALYAPPLEYEIRRFASRGWETSYDGEQATCAYSWAEVAAPVRLCNNASDLRELGYAALNFTLPVVLPDRRSDLTNLTLHVDLYPSRVQVRYTADTWQLYGTHLWGWVGGGYHLFLHVAGADGEDPALVSVSLNDNTVELIERIGGEEITIRTAFPGNVLYVQNNTLRKRSIPRGIPVEDEVPSVLLSRSCFVGHRDPLGVYQNVGMMAIFMDQMVYHPVGESVLFRVDMDKDNDGLLDIQERFPLSTEFIWDSDNDGFPDATDLITVSGNCTETILENPNDCLGDLVILWCIWAGITLLMLVGAFFLGFMRAKLVDQERITEAEIAKEEEARARAFLNEAAYASERQLLDRLEEQVQEIRGKMGRFERLENSIQIFLLLLTIFSVSLVIVPLWDKEPLPTRTLEIFTWIDLHTASVFAVDLLFRWFFRDDRSMTCFQFIKENWYDFPSLVCDLPGGATTQGLEVLVVARLLRVLRILKVFRVMRLYRKVTTRSAYLSLVLNHSHYLVPIIAVLLLVTVGVMIKIIEQDEQPVFASYWNCIWFCLVTATTVGYGDMTPKHWLGRILGCILMICGIGMIGNITARVSEGITQTGHQRAQEKEKQERHEDHPAIRLALLELSVPFNPLIALKDYRKEPVDLTSRQFMSPRYMEASVQCKTVRPDEQAKGEAMPVGRQNSASTLISTVADQDNQSSRGTVGQMPSSQEEEIIDTWCGSGVKGSVVQSSFMRADVSGRVHLPASELARVLRKDPEVRRLRRAVPPTEQAALDAMLHVLDTAGVKEVTWDDVEVELVRQQLDYAARAADLLMNSRHLEWDSFKWGDHGVVQKMRAMRKKRGDTIPKCMDKLHLLLLRYKLDESYKGVEDWEKMFHRLKAVIFRPPKKNGLVIEKMFSIGCFEDGAGEHEDNPLEVETFYDWQDPIDEIFAEVDVILRQHNVHAVEGFQEILHAVECIVMQFDRVECMRWALHHLEWGKPGQLIPVPRPPLVEERGKTGTIDPLLHLPRAHYCPRKTSESAACNTLLKKVVGMYSPPTFIPESPLRKLMGEALCDGDMCLADRRLQNHSAAEVNNLLNDPKGYLVCDKCLYTLCNNCAKRARPSAIGPLRRSMSRSSIGSLTDLGSLLGSYRARRSGRVSARGKQSKSEPALTPNTEPRESNFDLVEGEEIEMAFVRVETPAASDDNDNENTNDNDNDNDNDKDIG